VEAPVVQELVGANIEVTPTAERTDALTYTGRTPLGFGFQALRLYYDEGEYHAFTSIPTGMSMRAGGASDALNAGDLFMSSGRFARLSFT
jgi:hypothetical protein